MILVEGEKYACVRCIRGHRSSTCQHTQRTLVLVRSRGRPNVENLKRVAITAAEVDTDSCCAKKETPKPQCCSHKDVLIKSCCTENSRSSSPGKKEGDNVIVLKAKKKQIFNAAKGSFRLLDSVGDVPAGISKSHKNCACCKKAGPSKLAERLEKMDMAGIQVREQPQQPLKQPTQFVASEQPEVKIEYQISQHQPTTFDMYLAKPCSVPGSCLCADSDCNCDNCFIHSSKQAPMTLGDPVGSIQMYNGADQWLQQDMEECSCAPDECRCFQCSIHGIENGIRLKDGMRVSSEQPWLEIESLLTMLPKDNDFELNDSDCCCPDDACNCVTCFKHGRFGEPDLLNFANDNSIN